MTTFLHSAAMSLLSRTLQSVLSKYIVDVDVEGVALPSLLSTLGSSSSSNAPSSSAGDPSSAPGGESGWGVRLSNLQLQEGVQLMVLPGKIRERKPQESPEKRNPKRRRRRTERSRSYSQTTNEPMMSNEEEETSVKAPLEDSDSKLQSPTIATVPPPKGWFSGWFTSSSTTNAASVTLDTNEDLSLLSSTSMENLQEAACMPPSFHLDPQPSVNGEYCNGYFHQTSERQDDDDSSTASFAEEEDDDDGKGAASSPTSDGLPMVLKLGRDGTIGVLDVRLVGKTIHVMVEDADLTVEIVRQSPSDATPASTAAAPKKAASDSPPAPATGNLKTTGDRVLKENIIARYLSMIPNLFFRDIRVRLIIRDEASATMSNESMADQDGDDAMDGRTEREEYSPNDTVIELTIDLFSVNNGKDFLLNFGGEVDSDDTTSSSSSSSDDGDTVRTGESLAMAPASDGHTLVSTASTNNSNEFLTKRIRTGRGPEGGIVLKIYQAGDVNASKALSGKRNSTDTLWAREAWNLSTNDVLLRCSGLDVQAQIFLGTKKEIAISRHGYYEGDLPYNDFSVDAMLFGVDYIVPGPQPPLPAISNVEALNPLDQETWANSGVKFVEDSNGIQSCRIPSPFHKVARGLVPRHCSGSHLPCEWCHDCWVKDAGSARPHALDAATPLGGFVTHVSVRDPLEINVDRYNLMVLGTIVDLFTKSNVESNANTIVDGNESIPAILRNSSHHSETSNASFPTSTVSVAPSIDDSSRSGLLGRRVSRSQSESNRAMKRFCDYSAESAFPTYMKPEKIQMIGFHLSEVRFRVHIMKGQYSLEGGRSFSYWDVLAKCVTLDYQRLSAPERPFQDLRCDIGNLTAEYRKGVQRKRILSVGVQPRLAEFDDITVDTFRSFDTKHRRSSWPTTAAAIMDIMPTVESLVYADREHHGLQMRYLSVLDPSETRDRARRDVNVRVGAGFVDAEFSIKNDIICVIREASLSIIGPPKPQGLPVATAKLVDSVLKYKVIADGGSVNLNPLISASVSRTVAQGEISLCAGFSVEAFLDKCFVSYGKPSPVRALDQGLSFQQLASLPDFVRLRVLLFLKDLKPLETALGLPTSPNSFLRCRAVNIGIIKAAGKAISQQDDSTHMSRRQALMSELLMLDDDTLENLLALHVNGGN